MVANAEATGGSTRSIPYDDDDDDDDDGWNITRAEPAMDIIIVATENDEDDEADDAPGGRGRAILLLLLVVALVFKVIPTYKYIIGLGRKERRVLLRVVAPETRPFCDLIEE